jgi:hypothetical protein
MTRLSEDESPEVVLARLRSKRPEWVEDKKAPGLSKKGESRASYDKRLAAWEAAIEREEARRRV